MNIQYFIQEDGSEKDLCDAMGDMPTVGQIVYIRDNRNSRHISQATKYEVIRVDLSVSIDYKSMYDIEPLVKTLLNSGSEVDVEEANKFFGGKVFNLNFVEHRVEFSKTIAQVILKKITKEKVIIPHDCE